MKIICDIDIVKVMADLGLHVEINLETSNINDSGYVVDTISEIFVNNYVPSVKETFTNPYTK
jgi:hypothetical protein